MRVTPSLLGLLMPLALVACQKTDTPAPVASAAIPAASAAVAAADPNAQRVRGIYTWGPEVETLSPCGSDQTYWLNGEQTLLQALEDLAMEKADANNEAYQPIYVEVDVTDAGKATDGFAMDYDGVRELQRVHLSSKVVPDSCKLLNPPEPKEADDDTPDNAPPASAPASASRP